MATGQSKKIEPPALEGRAGEVALFKNTVHLATPTAPTEPRILYFHGSQGIGKSTLMRHLRDVVCPTLYAEARAQSQNSEAWSRRHADQGGVRMDATQVAFAYLDFEHDGNGVECPQIGAVALYAIARQLATYKVLCPLFTVACFMHFKAWARAHDKRDFVLLRTEELKALNAVWDASGAEQWPFVKALPAIMDVMKKYAGRLLDQVERNQLAERIAQLGALDPARELAVELPALLAEDLNRSVRHELGPARIVLLFDSHDAFWRPTEGAVSSAYFHLHDAWLRRLLAQLDRHAGITAVVAGRTKPLWSRAVHAPIAEGDVLTHELPGLTAQAARQVLVLRGVRAQEVEAMLVEAQRLSSLPAQGVHPATLEALALRKALPTSPVDRVEWLVAQVADAETRDALVVLSAFDGFGDPDYFAAGDLLRFAATRARLRDLVRDEWVEQFGGAGAPSYRLASRVHRILRETSREIAPDQANLWRDAHRALAARFDQLGERVRAAYHRAEIDPDQSARNAAAYLRGE